MKKTVIILIAALILLSFCGCSGNAGTGFEPAPTANGNSSTPGSENSPTAAPENTNNAENSPAATSAAETSPAEDPTAAPEQVAGSDKLEVTEKIDYVIICGRGECTDSEIVIPSHINGKPVTRIDEDAFRGDSLTSITFPWTVTSIGEDAFIECPNLASVTFSEGLTGISTSAFRSCPSLKSVAFPASLERVGNYAFRQCEGLEEVIFLGGTTLGNSIFEDCVALRKVTFGKGVYGYSIGSSCFSRCAALETVVFDEGLSDIGSWALSSCGAIDTLVLPKSLSGVGACAFQFAAVKEVYYGGSEEDWKNVTVKNSNESLLEATFTYNYGYNS